MKNNTQIFTPKTFVIDVDGVFTDGKFYYTDQGKVMKQFGPEDNDALTLLEGKLEIHCVTGDKRGFSITQKRIEADMGLKLSLVSTFERIEWINQHYNPAETIYMGDGIFDPLVFKGVGYAIAPQNAFYTTKEHAHFITNARGGEGAVAEACLHILEKFFNLPFDIFSIKIAKGSGAWKSP